MSRDHGQSAATLREVAAAAGVSPAAASLALRGSGKISPATRARVEQMARELRYVPNPLAAAFQSQIRQGTKRKFQATLAWINDYPQPDKWRKSVVWTAARDRCAQLGFTLDEIHIDPSAHMDEPEVVTRQFLRILRARGIHGVILPNSYRPALAAEAWDGVAVVLVGHFEAFLRRTKVARLREVIHHNVRSAVFWNTRLALETLTGLGSRRIGLVQTAWGDEAMDGEATARFLGYQQKLATRQRVPVLCIKSNSDRGTFLRWLRTHHPDAILCGNDEILIWAREAGLRVPTELRIAHLTAQLALPDFSGVDAREDRIGEAAVDLLTAHLIRNETGVPPFPKVVSIQGEWKNGKTT